MNRREIIKKLQNDVWVLHHVKGDHHQFKHSEKKRKITVPHPSKNIAIGTLKMYLSPNRLEMKYSVVIHKDRESYYSVTVPDLSGCFSAGATIEEALPIEEHQHNPEYTDGI